VRRGTPVGHRLDMRTTTFASQGDDTRRHAAQERGTHRMIGGGAELQPRLYTRLRAAQLLENEPKVLARLLYLAGSRRGQISRMPTPLSSGSATS